MKIQPESDIIDERTGYYIVNTGTNRRWNAQADTPYIFDTEDIAQQHIDDHKLDHMSPISIQDYNAKYYTGIDMLLRDRFEYGENPCDRCMHIDEVTDAEFPCSHCIHNANHVVPGLPEPGN